jgi:hypothetical protein
MMPQPDRSSLTLAFVGGCVLAALANAGVVSAQSIAEPRDVRVSMGPGSMGRYERGRWNVVAVNAANSGDEDTEANLTVFLENDSRTQFTRRFGSLPVPAAGRGCRYSPL